MDIEYLRAQLDIAAEAIKNCQDELPPPDNVKVVVVNPGDDVQAIIDGVPDGSILEFLPNERYVVGSLTFANKPITLKCHGAIPNRQIHPDDPLPILASGIGACTIDASFAHGLTLIGLFFEARADGGGDVIIIEDGDNITCDRIVIMGNKDHGQKRGIRGNGTHITVKDSYFGNIWAFQQDSQCYCAWNGAGPHTFDNCYFEGAGENVMFGGADNSSEDNIPSDITIRNCTFTKRDEWRAEKNKYSVKNLFELKMAKNVLVENCVFSKCWTDAQAGFAIVIKVQNQDGGNPWAVTENVVFKNCLMTELENGINISGHDPYQSAQQVKNINFENCRVQGSGIALQMLNGIGGVSVKYCTFENGYTFLSLDAPDGQVSVEGFVLHNTQGNHNEYGVKGSGTAVGQPSLDRFVQGLNWNEVLLQYPTEWHPYPPTTYFDKTEVPAGVEIGASI